MDGREVSSLPLSQSLISKLIDNGFFYVKSLSGLKTIELSKELLITVEEAQAIINCISQTGKEIKVQSAKDLISKRSIGRPVISFCRELDSIISGGFPIGQITEICGLPGTGKTQMAMQVAVNVQIPEIFGGNGAESIYIDTEGGFMVERAAELATAVANHLLKISRSRKMEQKARDSGIDIGALASAYTTSRLLEGIHIYRVHDQSELLALINQLPGILTVNTRIRTIVLDSIAFHFRQNLQDAAHRSRMLGSLSQQLNQIAFDNGVAIITTNHMTTKIEGNRGAVAESVSSFGPSSSNLQTGTMLIPALGEQWSHCVTNRILLTWIGTSERAASILKSPAWPNAKANFAITSLGIRDVPQASMEATTGTAIADSAAATAGQKRKSTTD